MAEIITLHRYAGSARVMASRIKNATDDEALEAVAGEMASLIAEGSQLVPVPSSSGINRSILVLATKIAALVPGTRAVEAVLRIRPVPSSHLLRKSGRPGLAVEDHVASMSLNPDALLDPEMPVIAIDNVITSGNTVTATEQVLGRSIKAVIYADASRKASLGIPSEGGKLRICFSGSRDYPALGQIDWVLETLPPDTVIVHGGARGVDQYVEMAARNRGFVTEVHRPDWEAKGRAAGPARNREMISVCDYLIAFWDGVSRGTAHTIREAIRQEKEFIVFCP